MDASRKQQLRNEAKIRRKKLSPESARLKSESICRRLHDWVADRGFKTVHTFLPMTGRGEPDILPFISAAMASGLGFIVPEVVPGRLEMNHHWYDPKTELHKGHWGVEVPAVSDLADPMLADVVLVPMLLADRDGYRIGYGKGYYDFFLARLDAMFVGICYDEEVMDSIPHENHDIPVHYIITDNRLIETGNSR